jgi:hypothetical protein
VKTRSMIVLLLVSAPIALFALVGTALADPPSTLINPPNHRHFIRTTDGGLIPVGPQICGHPEMQQAFNQFHYNVHHSELPGMPPTPVETLGPQGGAPGLHNQRGAELIGVPGCPAS